METKIRILDRQTVRAGHLLFEQGDCGSRAYFVEKGRVEVFKKDKHGNHVTIAEIGPGSIVGEMALVNNNFRTASVRALEDSVLVGISSSDLKKALSDTDVIFKAMMKIMVERLKKSNEHFYQQYTSISELEEAAQMTIRNLYATIEPEKQEHFRKEVMPLLEKLRTTLRKFDHPA